MSRSFILGAAVTLSLIASPAVAQTATAVPATITVEQAEQLIATLQQRNEQLREMAAQVSQMEASVAEAQSVTRDLEISRQALLIAAQRNADLVAIGEEIIADYERMNLGDRAANGEPLTGLFRVRLENKLQEFQSQIAALGFYPQKELDALAAAQAAGNP